MMSLAVLVDHPTGSHPASWLHPDTNPAGVHRHRPLQGHRPARRAGQVRPLLRRRHPRRAHRQPARLEPLSDVHERARAGDPADRARRRHDAHRPRRHRLHQLFRALQRRPPVRLARPHLGTAAPPGTSSPRPTTMPPATSATPTLPPHAERYERAGEFVDVVRELWDTWDDDAFVRDRGHRPLLRPGAACTRSTTTASSSRCTAR